MSEITHEELHTKLERMVSVLMEHCDTVSIIVTRKGCDDDWMMIAQGDGNAFARAGAMREWLTRDEEGVRHSKRSEMG